MRHGNILLALALALLATIQGAGRAEGAVRRTNRSAAGRVGVAGDDPAEQNPFPDRHAIALKHKLADVVEECSFTVLVVAPAQASGGRAPPFALQTSVDGRAWLPDLELPGPRFAQKRRGSEGSVGRIDVAPSASHGDEAPHPEWGDGLSAHVGPAQGAAVPVTVAGARPGNHSIGVRGAFAREDGGGWDHTDPLHLAWRMPRVLPKRAAIVFSDGRRIATAWDAAIPLGAADIGVPVVAEQPARAIALEVAPSAADASVEYAVFAWEGEALGDTNATLPGARIPADGVAISWDVAAAATSLGPAAMANAEATAARIPPGSWQSLAPSLGARDGVRLATLRSGAGGSEDDVWAVAVRAVDACGNVGPPVIAGAWRLASAHIVRAAVGFGEDGEEELAHGPRPAESLQANAPVPIPVTAFATADFEVRVRGDRGEAMRFAHGDPEGGPTAEWVVPRHGPGRRQAEEAVRVRLEALEEGEQRVNVTLAGDVAHFAWRVDTRAPVDVRVALAVASHDGAAEGAEGQASFEAVLSARDATRCAFRYALDGAAAVEVIAAEAPQQAGGLAPSLLPLWEALVTLPGLAPGSHALAVVAVDAAGNASPDGEAVAQFDVPRGGATTRRGNPHRALCAAELHAQPPRLTNATTARFRVSPSRPQCRLAYALDGGAWVALPSSPASHALAFPSLEDGAHALELRAWEEDADGSANATAIQERREEGRGRGRGRGIWDSGARTAPRSTHPSARTRLVPSFSMRHRTRRTACPLVCLRAFG